MKKLEVLSLGAGVQSTAILLMSCRGVLPKLDCAVFADTQWEPAAVYTHLDWLESEAAKYGIPVYRVTAGNLRQDVLDIALTRKKGDGKQAPMIPVFIKNPDGSRGMIRRQCTGSYKIEMVERCVRRELLGLRHGQRAPNDSVRMWIGISEDERRRGGKAPSHWQEFHYPLLDVLTSPVPSQLYDSGYTRQDCLHWLASHGYPIPPRSACIGCPFHSDAEWAALAPEEFEDACRFDEELRQGHAASAAERNLFVGMPYLHSSLIPLRIVQLGCTEGGPHGMSEECQGMCGV